MYLRISLLLPLLPILISASEPNTNLTFLTRQDAGCYFQPIVTSIGESFLTSCGTPGWGIAASCFCCGTANACVKVVQTCNLANGLCYDVDVPDPSPVTTKIPAVPTTNSPATSTIKTHTTSTTANSAQSSFNTATALSTSTSTAASMGLQWADIVRVVFVTGLLLAFGHVL
jgi:hypothetical protein